MDITQEKQDEELKIKLEKEIKQTQEAIQQSEAEGQEAEVKKLQDLEGQLAKLAERTKALTEEEQQVLQLLGMFIKRNSHL